MTKKTTLSLRVYTFSMSIFVTATPAPVPKTKDVKRLATFLAGVLVVMAVAQLFTFEEFLVLVDAFSLPFGAGMTHVFVAVLILAEVLALPFLLRMPLSPLFRWVSVVCGWFVPLAWLFVSVWLVSAPGFVTNVGFLGTAVQMMPGWWAVFMSTALGILVAWASWGMWPGGAAPKRVKKRRA
jgi:hypothetical protein